MIRDNGILLVIPVLVILVCITLYPIVSVTWMSFHKRTLVFDENRFTGLANYVRMVHDNRFWNAFKNTCYFTVCSVSVELILGLAIAVLLDRSFRGKHLMQAIILIPWAIPTVVSARMWEWMYNSDFGILNHLLNSNINWLGNSKWAIHTVILMDIWKTTPFVALLCLAGLRVIPRELYHAARVDGAGKWYVFLHVTIPLLKPVIMVVLLFRSMDAFRVFDAIYVLTGGGPANTTETLSVYAYKVLFQTLRFGYGSCIAMMVFMFMGVMSIFYIKILTRNHWT